MKRFVAGAGYAILGGAVIFGLTGCSIVGFGGDANISINKPKGGSRTIQNVNVGFLLGGPGGPGSFHAHLVTAPYTEVSFNGGTPTAGAVPMVRVHRMTRNEEDHGGFDPSYSGVTLASSPAGMKGFRNAEYGFTTALDGLTIETTDTNGDGFISAPNFGPGSTACGIASGIGLGGAVPLASFFLDDVTCFARMDDPVGTWTTGTTEGAGVGSFSFIAKDENGFNNSVIDNLPFATRQALLNSVRTQDDVVSSKGVDVVKARLTELRAFDGVYNPSDVRFDVVDYRNLRLDHNQPGWRAMLAWLADQVDAAADRGETAWRGSVTVNGSITVGSELLAGSGLVLSGGPTHALATVLRDAATAPPSNR